MGSFRVLISKLAITTTTTTSSTTTTTTNYYYSGPTVSSFRLRVHGFLALEFEGLRWLRVQLRLLHRSQILLVRASFNGFVLGVSLLPGRGCLHVSRSNCGLLRSGPTLGQSASCCTILHAQRVAVPCTLPCVILWKLTTQRPITCVAGLPQDRRAANSRILPQTCCHDQHESVITWISS